MHRDQAYPSGMGVVTLMVYCNFIAIHLYLLNTIAQLIYRCILVRNIAESDKIPSWMFVWHIVGVVVGGVAAVLQIVALIAALSIWSAEETDKGSRSMSWLIPIACVFAVLYLCTALVEVYAMLRVKAHNKWVEELNEQQQQHINMDNVHHNNQPEIGLEQYQHDTSGYVHNTSV